MHKSYGSTENNSSKPAHVQPHPPAASATSSGATTGKIGIAANSDAYINASTPTEPTHDKPIQNYLIRVAIIIGIVVCTPVITVATTFACLGFFAYLAGGMVFEVLKETNIPIVLTGIVAGCAGIAGIAAGVLIGVFAGPVIAGLMIYATALGEDARDLFT